MDLRFLALFLRISISSYLGEASFVGGDVNNGAVQFLNADVEFVDGHFQLFGVFDADELDKKKKTKITDQ